MKAGDNQNQYYGGDVTSEGEDPEVGAKYEQVIS